MKKFICPQFSFIVMSMDIHLRRDWVVLSLDHSILGWENTRLAQSKSKDNILFCVIMI
jgi:hypothetical protein